MLDLMGLMFSTVMLVIVITRAVQLDRRQAWFETVDDKKPAEAAVAKKGPRPWRRAEPG